jgi:hypothetical protein
MGAAGSTVPDALDEATFKTLAGDKFDQAKYDSLAKDDNGFVKKAIFLELAAAEAPAKAPAETPAEAPAEAPAETPAPVGPVSCTLQGMPAAIDAAIEAGLTPFIVDRSADHKVDTFFKYGGGTLIDAKAASLKVARKDITIEESQSNLNKSLSWALSTGGQIIFACQQASPNMSDLCHAGFPKEVFGKAGKDVCNEVHAAAIITDEDAEKLATGGIKIANPKFTLLVTSWFEVNDVDDFCFAEGMGFSGVGKDKFQIITVDHGEGTPLIE